MLMPIQMMAAIIAPQKRASLLFIVVCSFLCDPNTFDIRSVVNAMCNLLFNISPTGKRRRREASGQGLEHSVSQKIMYPGYSKVAFYISFSTLVTLDEM